MTPVWLLDIDGVINAVSREHPTDAWKGEWTTIRVPHSDGRTFPITAAAPVVAFLNDVHERGRAEIRWHTTWQHDAQRVADAFGLPAFPVADAPEFHSGPADAAAWIAAGGRIGAEPWWKLAAAQRVVQQERRPLVWTDDDITDSLRDYDMGANFEAHAPTLAVCPNHRTGLVRKDLDTIDAFLHDLEMNR